jgi:transglycosylase-like protein with SLT domain
VRKFITIAGSLVALALLPAAASAGPVFPTAHDDESGLTMHAAPNETSARVGRVPAGASVEVLCQASGQRETDPKYGASTLWDNVRYAGVTGYVTDLYVLTNVDRIPGVPTCGAGGSPPPPPSSSIPARPSWVPAQYWPKIIQSGILRGIDPRLLAAQLRIESGFRPTICSGQGACGIAQFLPGTWRQSWNVYRDSCGSRGYLNPNCAIPAQALLMQRLRNDSRSANGAAIRARMARRSDVPRDVLNRINFADRYQVALMAYHAGWDLSGFGPKTARYPVNIVAQAGRP